MSKEVPEACIDVLEGDQTCCENHVGFRPGYDANFSTQALESYAFAKFEPIVYDAMVLAAAVEYADRLLKRPALRWARRFSVTLPVHDPKHWRSAPVLDSLCDALGFLTGDSWEFEFVGRSERELPRVQEPLALASAASAILAYSDGMDSRAVGGLLESVLGDQLVRVRMGNRVHRSRRSKGKAIPFTGVPYALNLRGKNRESTGRSRGFKFGTLSGIASFLVDAPRIIVPESGQGAIAPALVTVAHGYPDYRNHPLFSVKMERFLNALFGTSVHFEFPRLWHTKGETLRAYVDLGANADWSNTRSCWRDGRWTTIDGVLRQCGACAACMLRRLSVHAAGLDEPVESYVCEDLRAQSLEAAVASGWQKRGSEALRQYSLAGVLHLDHFADLARTESRSVVQQHGTLIGLALDLPAGEGDRKLSALLTRHAAEWTSFLESLGPDSFVRAWTRC